MWLRVWRSRLEFGSGGLEKESGSTRCTVLFTIVLDSRADPARCGLTSMEPCPCRRSRRGVAFLEVPVARLD